MPPSVGKAQQTAVLLCIDDSPDLLECEKEFLETFGYAVLTAPSGSKGLELASTNAIDVAIVDYFMPEMNGHEFAIEMRRLRPQAPIIMLSGAVDVPKQALKLVDAFIATFAERASKEMDSKKLAALVNQLCCAFDERDKRRRETWESSTGVTSPANPALSRTSLPNLPA